MNVILQRTPEKHRLTLNPYTDLLKVSIFRSQMQKIPTLTFRLNAYLLAKCNIAQVLHWKWKPSNIEKGDTLTITSVPSRASISSRATEGNYKYIYLVGELIIIMVESICLILHTVI